MEKHIEKRLREAVKKKGGLALKLVCPGFTGITDRLVLMPGGRLIFVELKFGKGKLSARQIAVHRLLNNLNFETWIVTENNINEFLQQI